MEMAQSVSAWKSAKALPAKQDCKPVFTPDEHADWAFLIESAVDGADAESLKLILRDLAEMIKPEDKQLIWKVLDPGVKKILLLAAADSAKASKPKRTRKAAVVSC